LLVSWCRYITSTWGVVFCATLYLYQQKLYTIIRIGEILKDKLPEGFSLGFAIFPPEISDKKWKKTTLSYFHPSL